MIKDRMPKPLRAGKVRLGSPKSGNRPGKNVSTFRVDSDSLPQAFIDSKLGANPDSVDIHFIRLYENDQDNLAFAFDSGYESWLGQRKFCSGDGQLGTRQQDGQNIQVNCTCELLQQGKCKQYGLLRVGLTNLPFLGYWEVRTSSWSTIQAVPQLMQLYYNLLGEKFWTTKFQLVKKQQPGASGPVWVTHVVIHPDSVSNLSEGQIAPAFEFNDDTQMENPHPLDM